MISKILIQLYNKSKPKGILRVQVLKNAKNKSPISTSLSEHGIKKVTL